MKTKSFRQSRTFFVLFCVVFWVLAFMDFTSDASPRKYKGHAKQERVFHQRKALNLSEQYRIQNKGIKHYKHGETWKQ